MARLAIGAARKEIIVEREHETLIHISVAFWKNGVCAFGR